jgi:Mce-associated membrane protein
MTLPEHHQSATPTEPTEPTEPAEPLGPVEPAEPLGPVEPAEPLGPVEPAEPLGPAEPAEPLGPVEPSEPAESTQPAAPSVLAALAHAAARIGVPAIALTLVTVLMAVATGFLWLQVQRHGEAESARKDGLAASRDAARLLFSYDYRTLDKDFSTGRALTTGAFREQYASTTTKLVTDVATQYKAVVQANVVQAGVIRATPSSVVTIVYVNQVTTSTRVTGDKVDLSRVKMTLTLVDNRWLVSKVEAL